MQLEESLKHVLSQKEQVTEKFYTRLLSEYPEVRELFNGVDMKKQALMLSVALIASEAHTRDEYPAVEHYLQVLGGQHCDAGVPKEMFPFFRDCLISTIGSCHSDWTEEHADAWRAAIDKATQTMFEGYEDNVPS